MSSPRPIARLALFSLLVAGLLVVVGKVLDRPDALPFWGGLLAAFGEAALVGGLADWFAVRALFAHPMGIPFPHTALIPRNRQRIVREIRALVEKEWLPISLLLNKVDSFDFVGRLVGIGTQQTLTPTLDSLRSRLRALLLEALRRALGALEPERLAEHLSGMLRQGLTPVQAANLLADVVAQARQRRWLAPVVRDLVVQLERWSASPTSRRIIRAKLAGAAEAYRNAGTFKDLALSLGEIFGGVDLDHATLTIQLEMQRFAREQQAHDGQMAVWLDDALLDLERRLREDPGMASGVENLLADSAGLADLLKRVIKQLRDYLLDRLDDPSERWIGAALEQVDVWLQALASDPTRREQGNRWAHGLARALIEEHHGLIGGLVEEQMNRLSADQLSELIQTRVGEDLNWIRLNGTFVGGLIGVTIYLVVELVKHLS